MATPIDVIVFKCPKICPTGNRRNRALFTSQKQKLAPRPIVATARIIPKVCQGQPPIFVSHYFRFHPNQFTFGKKVIADRVKAVLCAHSVNPIFARSESSLRTNNGLII